MKRHSRPALAAALTAAYLAFSIGALASFNLGLPPWLEGALSAAAAPGVLLLGIWAPVLRPLGLAGGEMFGFPTPLGCLLLVASYAGLAFLLSRLIGRRRAGGA